MKNIEIMKVEIGSKRIVVHYSEIENEIVNNYTLENTLKNKGIHPDLRKALEKLNPYLADVFYLKAARSHIQVDCIELGTNKATNYVILSGTIALSSGNLSKIKTDKIKMDVEECPYGFDENLKLDIGVLMNEVKLYCFEGKQAQLDLFKDSDVIIGKELPEKEQNETPQVVKDLTAKTVKQIKKEEVKKEGKLF